MSFKNMFIMCMIGVKYFSEIERRGIWFDQEVGWLVV